MQFTKNQIAILDILQVKRGRTFADLRVKVNLALGAQLTLEAMAPELWALEKKKLVGIKLNKYHMPLYQLTSLGNKTKVKLKKSDRSQGTG